MNRRLKWLMPIAAACLPLFVLSACRTIEQAAPPVDASMAGDQATRQSLARGRDVYLRQCTSCHTAEPVTRYTQDQWQGIITRMAPKSKLSVAQTADLRLYIQTVARE